MVHDILWSRVGRHQRWCLNNLQSGRLLSLDPRTTWSECLLVDLDHLFIRTTTEGDILGSNHGQTPPRASLRRSAGIIFFFAVLSKLGGLIRQFTMALVFGTSATNDAWLIASLIPNLFFGAISGAISVTTVPLLAEADARYSPESTNVFINQAFAAISVIVLGLSIFAEVYTPILTRWVAPGFNPHELRLTIQMARVVMPTLWFQAIGGFFSGILQEREQYSAPAAIPVFINVIRIVGILALSQYMGIMGVAVGFTIATIMQLVLLIAPLHRARIRLYLVGSFDHPLLKTMGRMSLPYFINVSVNSIEIIVDRILSSYLVTGSIAAINYSYTLVQVPITMLLGPITTPLLTRLSQQHSQGEHQAFRQTALRGFELTLFVLAPVTVWFVTLRIPILVIIFQHGAFSSRSTQLTARTLLAFGLGIPGFGITFYLKNLFFASKDTRVPARYGIIAIACNVAGDLTLVHLWQAAGLSLSTSIANWINATLLIRNLLRKNILNLQAFKTTLIPLLMASGAMLALWVLAHIFISPLHLGTWALMGWTLSQVVLSGLIYLAIVRQMNHPGYEMAMDVVKSRLAKKL